MTTNTIIKKFVTFTPEEWAFIQNYKHTNKLKSDMDAIKAPIENEMKRIKNIILSSVDRNADILKELADK